METRKDPQDLFVDAYQFFDLELTEPQKKYLDKLVINTTKEYCNYGKLDELLDKIQAYIHSLGEADPAVIMAVAEIIDSIVKKVLAYFKTETAIVILRASLPNNQFAIPRWHTDGNYFGDQQGTQCKAAVTLKGPCTLFYNIPKEKRQDFAHYQTNDPTISFLPKITKNEMTTEDWVKLDGMEKTHRRNIDDFLGDKSKVVSPSLDQGAYFKVGDLNTAAVHSEPHITSNRLFLSVLPGSKKQIQDYEEAQGNVTKKMV
jgi:hypothetical protein